MIDKPAFHMFLDKCIPMISEKESLWTGGQSDVHAFLLLNLFRSVLDDKRVIPTLTEEDKALVKAILDQVFQSFALFIEKYKQNRQLAVREYCAFSQDPSIQFPILIPSGCASHATLLSIEKNPDGKTAKLTLFNTGKGIIEHHPHFEGDVRHFQTWLAYDNIPLTEFTETFFMGVLNAKDRESIDELYVCFHEIGKKGIPVPPSDSKQDYEQKQMQGTCSAQCLMAFLRYFIFAQAPGTLWHKLGFYKMLKATTFSLAAPRLKNVDQRIQPFVDKKLKKQEYELKIAEIARDEKRVSICQQAVFGALEKIGEGEFIAKIRSVPPNTQWERFGLLRAAVRHLSHKLTGSDLYQEFFNDNKDLEDILMIIDSLIAEKNAAEMHILSMLNMLKAKGDQAKLLEVLAKFIHSPHHADVIVSWVEKAVAEDPGFLTRFPDGYKRMIFFWFLKEDLAKKGNIELANLVE